MNFSQKAALIWAAGVSIFSLFFGAGNVVFPLTIGLDSGQMLYLAFFGLCITAIGGPLLGLFGVVLFEGDPKKFFAQLGTVPGYLAVLLIILLIGPIGAMPRCFTVSYSAIKSYFPDLSLFAFNIIAGIVTLLLIWRRNFVLPILGYFLSPLLLISLFVIIVVGLFSPGELGTSVMTSKQAIMHGVAIGYDTMDVLAAIFFAVTVWSLLQERINPNNTKELVSTYSMASLLGGFMLILVYLGLSYAAAKHANVLQSVAPDEILATLAINLLGPKLSIVANVAVALACLTTVMGLCMTVADIIHFELKDTRLFKKLPYEYDLMIFVLLVFTVIMANFGFAAIMKILHPIIAVCYPALIVLTIGNIVYKTTGFKFIKIPVYATLLTTFAYQYLI